MPDILRPQDTPFMPEGFEFHHMGYATRSIEHEMRNFEAMGYRLEGSTFIDETQGIAGCFMTGAGPRIELLENLAQSETLTPWLNAGIKLYHWAWLVRSMDGAIAWARAQRGKVIVQPVPAVAFGGRHISFVMLRNGFLMEFIEH